MNEEKYLITDFGAQANTAETQTAQIQRCIDMCHANGGGTVVIPAGTFVIGSLRLFSNMTLYLEKNATLLGSPHLADYTDFHVPTTIHYLYDDFYREAWNLPDYYFYAMITAFHCENISIIGEEKSTINGHDVLDPNGEEKFRGPMGIIMSNVTNLHLKGYTFINSSNWSHTLDGCQHVQAEKVTVKAGHDGFNLHHSTDIQVENCRFETGDDCFAGYDIENLTVKNCYLNTACNAMRIGGKALVFEHCEFAGPGAYPHISEETYYTHAIFKYYAIIADTIQTEYPTLILRNNTIVGANKLLVYEYGQRALMQDHVPLRELVIENTSIAEIAATSKFFGNGEPVKLVFKEVTLDVSENLVFLEVDASVELVFANVNFVNPTRVIIAGEEKVFAGNTNFSTLV
jgi:hypothetical protein